MCTGAIILANVDVPTTRVVLARRDWLTGDAITSCLEFFTSQTQGNVVFVNCEWERYHEGHGRFINFNGYRSIDAKTTPDTLLFLNNPDREHWSFFAMFPKARKIILFDPLYNKKLAHLARKTVSQYFVQAKISSWVLGNIVGEWNLYTETTSIQGNLHDCGRMVVEGCRRFIYGIHESVLDTEMDDVHGHITQVLTYIRFLDPLPPALPPPSFINYVLYLALLALLAWLIDYGG